MVGDADMAGPLVFCFAFMASLLLGGKVAFGYIYGLGLMGCLGMYLLLNLMSVGLYIQTRSHGMFEDVFSIKSNVGTVCHVQSTIIILCHLPSHQEKKTYR